MFAPATPRFTGLYRLNTIVAQDEKTASDPWPFHPGSFDAAQLKLEHLAAKPAFHIGVANDTLYLMRNDRYGETLGLYNALKMALSDRYPQDADATALATLLMMASQNQAAVSAPVNTDVQVDMQSNTLAVKSYTFTTEHGDSFSYTPAGVSPIGG
ncbi:MAG: hypothetical protein SFZ03_04340 [Candidatus Melainabacteria bacterium]|nr:hypothetical protein [Candidatus Melainabacteria bacterium]